jgi:hypothetical protein
VEGWSSRPPLAHEQLGISHRGLLGAAGRVSGLLTSGTDAREQSKRGWREIILESAVLAALMLPLDDAAQAIPRQDVQADIQPIAQGSPEEHRSQD